MLIFELIYTKNNNTCQNLYHLALTCKINYVNMRDNKYVNMRLIYVNMQLKYVDMHAT